MSKGISPKDLAAELNVSPKTVRRVLRKLTDDRAGRGGNWDLTAEACDAIANALNSGTRRTVRPTLKSDQDSD